ncbi:MAG TPA: 16S rRNA (guanine(966)-N(2))-methyltransferase RsmD [Acidobacteriaceae bacterium]|nr:16S rRNA (guanine(966)-N(2))-methyltransferase RsmD [Acidobacteriaceae bacterium]
MRVIAGSHRSRQLVAPRGTGTRPTSDRLRETLFNILAPRVAGCRFADLYAGTGAVGIEAMSRGAEHAWFAEKAEPALESIRANLKALKITHNFTLEERGTGALLERLAKAAVKRSTDAESERPSAHATSLDIVYLDPPWEAEAEYGNTLHLLGSNRVRAVLSADALVIAEHSSKMRLAGHYGELKQTRTLKQGDAALTFYAVVQPAEANSRLSAPGPDPVA